MTLTSVAPVGGSLFRWPRFHKALKLPKLNKFSTAVIVIGAVTTTATVAIGIAAPDIDVIANGYWYSIAAFSAGAIIGGAMANQNQPRITSSRHVQWCADRYRSYRASDNTYVPRAGVRAVCNSPYN